MMRKQILNRKKDTELLTLKKKVLQSFQHHNRCAVQRWFGNSMGRRKHENILMLKSDVTPLDSPHAVPSQGNSFDC